MQGESSPAEARRPGSATALTLLAYALTLFSMATIGGVAPLVGRFAAATGVPVAQVGLAIALFSIPSALGSGAVGSLADQWCARRMLALSSLAAAGAAFLLYAATSLTSLRLGLLGAGIAFCGVVVSAPALLIERLSGGVRSRALSLWSSYGPAGFAIGLLLSAPFASGTQWRTGLAIVGGLLLVGGVVALAIPPSSLEHRERAGGAGGLRSFRALLRNRSVLRLALAIALPTGISYGTSLLMPSYLTSTYGVSLATASGVVALAKLAIVVAGGMVSGWLLSRRLDAHRLFLVLAVAGVIAQTILYLPSSGFPLAVTALAVWLFAYAGMAGVAMALLPTLLDDPATSGAASGLVSQTISIASFAGSVVYFSGAHWSAFVAIAVVGVAIAFVLLPGARRADPVA